MNILYIHQYFITPNDPGGTRSYWLAREFVKKGHNVTMLTSSSKFEEKIKQVKIDGIDVIYIKVEYSQNMSFYRRLLAFTFFILKSTRVSLKLKNIDLVLATSTPLSIGIPALIKKIFHKTPYVFEVRDVWPEAVIAIGAVKNNFFKFILYKLESIIYLNSSAITPLSSGMKDSIINRFDNLNIPIITIPNISDIEKFNTNQDLNQKKYLKKIIGFHPDFSILYAGTFGQVNGISYVIELAEKIFKINENLIFILIGSGSLKKEVIEKAKEKGVLNKNLFILDSIPKADLPSLYSEISMGSSFVIPVKELWNNSANKFFDTLAAGKPVLINYGGWQKKIIEDNDIGYVLPISLDETSIEKFNNYTKNKLKLDSQGENALKIATELYSLDVAVNKYLSLFDQISHIYKQRIIN